MGALLAGLAEQDRRVLTLVLASWRCSPPCRAKASDAP